MLKGNLAQCLFIQQQILSELPPENTAFLEIGPVSVLM
jgi:hypothetical protein